MTRRKKPKQEQPPEPISIYAEQVRSYKEASKVGGVNSDWPLTNLTEDQDYSRNYHDLLDRSRDLWKTNPYMRKYSKVICDEVYGHCGIALRMDIVEQEDRVVYAEDERAFLVGEQKKHDDEIESFRRAGVEFPQKFRKQIVQKRGEAKIKAGQLDLYACNIIEKAWKRWQQKQFATVSGRFNYNESRCHRLRMAARDGDCFIRLIEDPQINEFGFTIQIIPGDMCPYYLNRPAAKGLNEIRMGIEIDEWGRHVAYYFKKRAQNGAIFHTNPTAEYMVENFYRLTAEECIHYGLSEDHAATRPVPWVTGVIGILRQLDRYEEAAVMAARIGACQTVFLESTMIPEGGSMEGSVDPSKMQQTYKLAPGTAQGLPYGVTAKQINPNYPHENFSDFRKAALRTVCAGLPGASYAVMASDFESVNFSAGRLDRLSVIGAWMALQQFDIETAECRIFECWLRMALTTGAIPLPLAKFEKFNRPVFQGRRWAGVDPIKEAAAHGTNIQNLLTSRTRIHDELGTDFEQTAFELAREKMLLEDLGLVDQLAVPDEPQDGEDSTDAPPKRKQRRSDHQPMNIIVNVPSGKKTTKLIRDKDGRVDAMEQTES